jgi:hypothetical protein
MTDDDFMAKVRRINDGIYCYTSNNLALVLAKDALYRDFQEWESGGKARAFQVGNWFIDQIEYLIHLNPHNEYFYKSIYFLLSGNLPSDWEQILDLLSKGIENVANA